MIIRVGDYVKCVPASVTFAEMQNNSDVSEYAYCEEDYKEDLSYQGRIGRIVSVSDHFVVKVEFDTSGKNGLNWHLFFHNQITSTTEAIRDSVKEILE